MNKTILTKEGYLLKKKYNKHIIDEIKNELTVSPYIAYKQNIKPIYFPVYLENNKYLCIPKYYGLLKCGPPNKNKEIIGCSSCIDFKGTLRDNQIEISKIILSKLEKDDGGVLSLHCGVGKCLGYNTPILMYDGTISLVQHIKVGDKIMGDESLPRNILSLAHGYDYMYKIITQSGYYIVNSSHILSLYLINNKYINITVLQYLNLSENIKNMLYGYRVAITFPKKKTLINPYLYGYWIKENSLYNNYKINSVKNQLALLAGIIDYNSEYINNYYVLFRKNYSLLNDINYIARALGYCTILTHQYIIIYGNGLNDLPILNIKKKQFKKSVRPDLIYYKIKIIKLNIDKYYGFEIDGNKHFVLGDFTVTHNTVLSLYVASVLKLKTLVIVHKSFLLNQWVARTKEFTTANIGIIQQNKIIIDGKDIVIGMLQSIAKDKYNSEIFRDFGLVIFDEAHHAPSKYFSKALPIIACKKTLALTATPNRADKLEKILFWYFGDIIYKSPNVIIHNVLVNIIKYNTKHPNYKEYKQNYGKEINRPKTINKIIKIENRNIFIINNIISILINVHRKILILSDRIDHLKILKDLLYTENNNISTGFYIGGLKQSILSETEKAKVIFASYSMASEALDIPTLNTLIMVTPRKEVEQSVGRITRKINNEIQPLIIDIVDTLPSFIRQGRYRKQFYKKKGFLIKEKSITDIELIDNILTEELTDNLLTEDLELININNNNNNDNNDINISRSEESEENTLDNNIFID